MIDEDFIDFMMTGGHYLLFPEDFGEYECLGCGYVVHEGDKVEVVNATEQIIKCPECGQEIEIE